MATTVDDIFIMNQALRYAKVSQSITSRTDGSAYVKTVAFLYDETLAALISNLEWNFAVTMRRLNRTASTPLNKRFTYEFVLPSDYESIRELIDTENGYSIRDYEIVDEKLYTNVDDTTLRYMRTVDESQMPAWFRKYLAYSLAIQIAPNYGSDQADLNYLVTLHDRAEATAISTDANESPAGGLDTESSILEAANDMLGN